MTFPRRINILHLIAPTQFGGAERVLLNIAETINTSRFNIMVGSFLNIRFKSNKFTEKLVNKKIPNTVFFLKRTMDIDNIPRILRLIRKNKINIMHTHGYRSDIIGLVAAKITKIPIVSTIHGWTAIDFKLKFYEQCDRIALRFFDCLIPVSDHIKKSLIESGVDSRKTIRLHNAVDVEFKDFKPERTSSLNIRKRNGEFLIGTIGRLSPEKNIPNFLKAASLLIKKYDNIKFLIVGDGFERSKLEDLALNLGLRDNIQFTGFVHQMDRIYNLLDLLVISSSTEGIPLVMLEAMKYSIPVVSTKVGGIPEVIENGIDGILVDSQNSTHLHNAIEDLIINKNKYVEVSRNARKKIAKDFNRSDWIREIEKIYINLFTKRMGISNE